MTQPSDTTMQMAFAPSQVGMPNVEPVTVELPSGGGSDSDAPRLLRTITVSDAVLSIEFDEDDDGNPFEVRDLMIYAPLNVSASQDTQFAVVLNNTFWIPSKNASLSKTNRSIVWISYWLGLRYVYMGFSTYNFKGVASSAPTCTLSDGPEKITKIKLTLQNVEFESGTFFVYGR